VGELETEAHSLKVVEKRLTEIREEIRDIVEVKRAFISQYCIFVIYSAKCYSFILPRFEQ
jgi:hypothetical protein